MSEVAMAGRSGCGARQRNEDDWRTGGEGARRWAVLADGAGGHRDGALAARCVVEAVAAGLSAPDAALEPAILTRVVADAHEQLRQAQQGAVGQERMHATVVALWLDAPDRRVLWSHVGDSRLYRLRGGAVELLTRDDSLVQQLRDAGLLTERQALEHPRRNQLMAALGMPEEVEPHTPAAAAVLEEGDVYLLCSDGWWGALQPQDLADTLAQSSCVEAWLQGMCARIEARAAPGQDNFTAVGVWVGNLPQPLA
ncbi:PP2C family protein-serine/threonine phosphatase [Azohydromonas caseinilytica]|uniref:Serine/threonine-protein phosphatase n=1 Tax=Azohydromonas caseinilytica TaxID=2728836 RepID=A0A848FGK7_9BURK|nr:protein phosphatase 2C domain-containing protein [Azohydromonas caseinilytica]NML18276.1 serine/threonine-protein phosphatase [Azohydromonas caseinilytica]